MQKTIKQPRNETASDKYIQREMQICSRADRQTGQTDVAGKQTKRQTDMPQNATSKFVTTVALHTHTHTH